MLDSSLVFWFEVETGLLNTQELRHEDESFFSVCCSRRCRQLRL